MSDTVSSSRRMRIHGKTAVRTADRGLLTHPKALTEPTRQAVRLIGVFENRAKAIRVYVDM